MVAKLQTHGGVPGSRRMGRAEAWQDEATRATETANPGRDARFEAAFHNASVLMHISRLDDGRLVEVNEAFCDALGFSRPELIGKSVTELGLVDFEDRQRLVRPVMEHGRVRDVEVTYHRRDGRLLRGSASSSALEVDGVPCLLTAVVDMTERRAAEDALRASEARFAAAFKVAGVMMVIVRASDGVIVDVNQAFLRDTGYEREEVIGKTTQALALFADPSIGAQIGQGVRRDGYVRNLEARVVNRAGEIVYGLFSTEPVDIGGVPHLVTTVLNVTRSREAQEALRTSEARYRNLVEQTADGVLLLDDDARIIDTNPAMAELLGRSMDELRGTLWPEYVDRAQLVERPFLRPALEAGKPMVFERRVLRPDGSTVELEIHARQFERGWMLGTARDVGARKAAERERARLIQAIEQSAESIIITDPSGAIVYVNPNFAKETGFAADEVIGQNHRILRSAADNRPNLYADVLDTIAREGSWSGEIVSSARDGSLLHESVSVSAVRDPSGALVNYVAVQRNITRERELEDQLRQAQKMEAVGRLAGGIAHDFNNLLTAVNGYADLLISELGDSPLADDALEIRRAGARAAELTRQVLAFARRQVLAPRAVDVNVAVGSVGQMLGRLLGEQIRLATTLSPQPAVVMADPGQLEQVLVNLAINARDAMPDGGTLEISVARLEDGTVNGRGFQGPAVFLAVTDTGTGMDEATLGHAFEPFFTTKMAGSGTGLGLATVHGIVHQSHGEVWAESSVGHGTRISILLPRVDARPDKPGGVEAVMTEPAGKATVLVVEDESAVRGFVVSTLERAGYRVLVAASPAEAIALTSGLSEPIDLLVTDMVMPDISGLSLAHQLVASRPSLRVILMSGYDPGLVSTPVDGQFQFLAKPFGRDELTAAVAGVLAEDPRR